MIFDYFCKKCEAVQEKWHKLAETNTEKCEKCGAPPEELQKMLSHQKCRNKTWGLWAV